MPTTEPRNLWGIDLCAQAARLLDDVAGRATPGPWSASLVRSPDSTCTSGVYCQAPGSSPSAEVIGSSRARSRPRGTVIGPAYRDGGIWRPEDAEWVALVSPAVAGPLAAWLRAAGELGSTGGTVPFEAATFARALLDHAPAAGQNDPAATTDGANRPLGEPTLFDLPLSQEETSWTC